MHVYATMIITDTLTGSLSIWFSVLIPGILSTPTNVVATLYRNDKKKALTSFKVKLSQQNNYTTILFIEIYYLKPSVRNSYINGNIYIMDERKNFRVSKDRAVVYITE